MATTTQKTWAQLMSEIDETFRKWTLARAPHITAVAVGRTPAETRKNSGRATTVVAEREVTLTFAWRAPGEPERTICLTTGQEARPVANLARLAQVVETLRLAEMRGVGALLASAYRQLTPPPAPAAGASPRPATPRPPALLDGPIATTGPYAVLQLPADAPLAVAEVVSRALLMAMATDVRPEWSNWSGERMLCITNAMEQIRAAHNPLAQRASTPVANSLERVRQ